jgi:hypothetical protein
MEKMQESMTAPKMIRNSKQTTVFPLPPDHEDNNNQGSHHAT